LYIYTPIKKNLFKMKKTNMKSILILALFLSSLGITAQNSLLEWNQASRSETDNMEKAFRNTSPEKFQLHSVNLTRLKDAVAEAPVMHTGISNVIIELPTKNGVLQSFRVYEASSFAPELQEEHTNIRSYMGQGIEDASAIARFSISDTDGLHAMISSVKNKTIYIDPYTTDRNYYISYSVDSLEDDFRSFECLIENSSEPVIALAPENADDGMLRTFRLALACTTEYAQFHLTNQGIPTTATDAEKIAAILVAMNTAMTRINGIYERDLAVHLEIVPNNEDLIFLPGTTDPYTNNDGGAMLSQNISTCNSIIGAANYDIGHVFSTGGGGVAFLRSVCNSNKAGGVTGLNSPIGDFFYVDFVSHEMGHQFGGNHTQNNNCQRAFPASVETGSGSTIMGYAGICSPNVQNTSDDYFGAWSIQEMWNHISSGSGQCAIQTPTGNLPPTADAGPNVTIPKSTPFILKGIATDPDGGNVLSHCWEQMNPQAGTMPPVSTSTEGPMFRTIDPLPNPERYMPNLSTILTGQTQNTWEVVPSVARSMIFRYTVRDNVAGGAASASDNMIVFVDGTAGPFVVTSQMTATTWQTQGFETITWDVAGTDVAPVDSPFVDVLFSTDGGLTYDILAADDIPNTGTASIWVPTVNTTTGRFMIISSNNIFMDINDGVITIEGSLSTDDFTFDNLTLWPNPTNGEVQLSFTPASNKNIEVALYDLRGRLIDSQDFDSNGNTFNQTINYSRLNTGLYFVKITNGNESQTIKLILK
jgi:hypothetical protein